MTVKVPSLGSAVADYTNGLIFLRAVTPVLLAASCALFYAAWAAVPVRVAYLVAGALSTILAAIGVYGYVRISLWLPSVCAPAYALVGADGRALVPASCSPWARPQREVSVLAALAPADRARVILRAVYSDRLGNRVFQYVFARLRAAHLGVDFEAPPLGGPWGAAGGAVALRVSAADGLAALARADLSRSVDRGGSCVSGGGGGGSDGERAVSERETFLLTPSSRYCMNASLFAPHDATIANWLRPGLDAVLRARDSASLPDWRPQDVAVHVRVGDIMWGHHAAYRPLPVSFYRNALARIPAYAASLGTHEAGRVFFISEDAAHALVTRLVAALRSDGHDVTARGGASVDDDLAALYSAPAVVLSVSSFAWWPAVLSRVARTVVVPCWGLLRPHAWEPAPRDFPGCTLFHDMTVRCAADAPRGAVVEVVDLSALPCWEGNTAKAWATLFD